MSYEISDRQHLFEHIKYMLCMSADPSSYWIFRRIQGVGRINEDAVDYELKKLPLIASGDAIILDECDKWFNLVRCVIEKNIGDYPYVDICPVVTGL